MRSAVAVSAVTGRAVGRSGYVDGFMLNEIYGQKWEEEIALESKTRDEKKEKGGY